jgi:excisionase family DNA binding protein
VSTANPHLERLAFSITEVATALGIGRRTLERLIASGKFPKPDLRIGRMPRWKRETVRAWIENGGGA